MVVLVVGLLSAAGCGAAATATATRAAATPVAAAGPSSPAVAAPTLGPAGAALGSSKQAGDLAVSLFVEKAPARGVNTIQAQITDAAGKPVNDATVTFDIDMTNMSHGRNVTPAVAQGNGRYAGKVSFMMPGPWRLIVGIQRPGQPAASTRFDFNVNR